MALHPNPTPGDGLRVMTFNILFRTARNPAGPWEERRPLVTQIVRDWLPDAIGIQEAMEEQIVELKRDLPEYGIVFGRRTGRSKFPFWSATLTPALLGGAWAANRLGRSAGARCASAAMLLGAALPVAAAATGWMASGSALVHGAFCPILYRRDRLRVVEATDVFLSEKLDDPATFLLGTWIHRVANQVRFERISDGKQFTFFNAHLDYIPRLADGTLKKLRAAADEEWDGQPQILLGDFNADLDSRQCAYLTAPGAHPYDPPGFRSMWCDAERRPGPVVTSHHGLGAEAPSAQRADHIMCRPSLQVSQVATVVDRVDDTYPSDHFPVVADCFLTPQVPRSEEPRRRRARADEPDPITSLP